MLLGALILLTVLAGRAVAVELPQAPWVADQGDSTYKNPVLFADYSDPDVVRVGKDFYLTASSFNCVPGLPILHSRDLVNWRLIGHAVQRLPARFEAVLDGQGLWAPAIRYHEGYYWIFVGDPDWGILMTRTKDPAGPWEKLHVVKKGKGLIDPCPLWDDDGRAYLVHALAKSRAGQNSIIIAQEMTPDGREMIGEERLVIDGRDGVHPTIEGPKFYKRGPWYYIFAPAGGVKAGWQLAARSKGVFGPYKVKRVMEQGSTDVNGPHQGAWVDLPSGENWFVHFQDRGPYGRVVHLNPLRWQQDWPLLGADYDRNGVGEPVPGHRKPTVDDPGEFQGPETSDEFDEPLGLQWQWQGNPQPRWASLADRPGWLRLSAVPSRGDLAAAPNQLLQKFPAPSFTVTTPIELNRADEGDRAGLVVMGQTYAALLVQPAGDGLAVSQIVGQNLEDAHRPGQESAVAEATISQQKVWLRVVVGPQALCDFSYSVNGRDFNAMGERFAAKPGRWTGAKVGLVCQGEDAYADFKWFRIE